MGRILSGALSLLVVSTACGPAEPPYRAPSPTHPGVQTPPVYGLIGHRDRLDLTSSQVVALEEVARELEERTRPHVRHLERIRDRRVLSEEEEEGARLAVGVIRQESREALVRVEEILGARQREEVCRLFDDRDPRARARDRPPEPRRIRTIGREAPGEEPLTPIRWHWCEPEEDPAEDPDG